MQRPSQETTLSSLSAALSSPSLISLPCAARRTEIDTEGRAGAQSLLHQESVPFQFLPPLLLTIRPWPPKRAFITQLETEQPPANLVIFGKASTHTEIIYSALPGSARASEERFGSPALQPCSPSAFNRLHWSPQLSSSSAR